ncbi:TetR/AcrR family transcriptional regulator [Paenibacillus sp. 19GGS1-52]|uniref:TetR/AcrR family transcriptional regulator n=1 Tax=Paenibacillus sp. 19GGS1-52 TaxID=2758563 RepID=UPI001EFA81B9|nr:TetR/AcrR family transcriptional regulator [Paenibacillus sp. 19GGS1-52]
MAIYEISLIEAGIQLINKDGIKSFSLRKVAAECSISHTAPYSHFKNIDELITAMGEHVTEQFMDTLRTSVQGKEGSHETAKKNGLKKKHIMKRL